MLKVAVQLAYEADRISFEEWQKFINPKTGEIEFVTAEALSRAKRIMNTFFNSRMLKYYMEWSQMPPTATLTSALLHINSISSLVSSDARSLTCAFTSESCVSNVSTKSLNFLS